MTVALRSATLDDVAFLADVVITATRAQGRFGNDVDEAAYRAGYEDWTRETVLGHIPDCSLSVIEQDGPSPLRRTRRRWPHLRCASLLIASGSTVASSARPKTTKSVGFVAVRLHQADRMGEISVLAVDPDAQGRRVGGALTAFALDRMQAAGMAVAMVETGGDPGHAPARHTYEKQGFQLFPVARYFQKL